MRIVSYNILDGGEGRADPLAEVILAQRPDVVALVEADNVEVLDRISRRLHMDHFHAQGVGGNAALLSRWPIMRAVNHAPLCREISKSFFEADVRDPSGRTWNVGVVHLHARALESDEVAREQEIRVILDRFAPRRRENSPHLLVGDFNANAPDKLIDPTNCKPATREAWHANGGQLPRRVVSMILDAGYVDVHALDPETARTRGTFSTQHPGQRVDYIFAFGIDRACMRDAWIEQDRLAKYASDHFPVGAEIE